MLGKYQAPVLAIVVVLSVLAAIAMHFLGRSDEWIDGLALLALGAVYGTAVPRHVDTP